jgi:hypothetical protein
MDRSIAIFRANVALIGLVWYLRSRAQKDPRKFWVLLLYGVQVGPRTDVAHMRKGELLESGIRFITWGLIFMSAFWANNILMAAIYAPNDPHGFFVVVMFLTTLFSGMGFLGGLYLLVRWLFRRSSYVPPSNPS